MPRITYQDFDLIFDRTRNEGEYIVNVYGESGDVHSIFTLSEILNDQPVLSEPSEDDNLASRHINFAAAVGKPENYYLSRRRPPDLNQAKKLGGLLFERVFQRSVWSAFKVRREQLDRKAHLRVRLNLSSVPELATLPWEYLYNSENSHFYAQLPGTPVVRYLNIDESIRGLTVDGALRMLVVISSPAGAAQLNVENEWEKLRSVLKPLEDENLIRLERLETATLSALQDKLQENVGDNPFHIFHFIGHGVFDRQTGGGFLLFEDENRNGRLVRGEDLSLILNEQGFHLAVINACEGAISARSNSYAGVAQTLCREAVIPAVLAMQFEITDGAAIVFAENFYRALTKDFPVEAALGEARKAIRIMPNEVEWATPVLYMRSKDGHLFIKREENNTGIPPSVNGAEPVLPQPPALDLPPALVEHYNAVYEALRDGQLVPFVGLDANLLGRNSDPEAWQRGKGLPDSAELARYLSRKFKYPLPDLPDLARIAQYSIAADRPGRLYDEISEIFTDNINKPTLLHTTIAGLAAKVVEESNNENSSFLLTKDPLRRCFLVVTTGYDNLFEEAFKKTLRGFHVVSYTARGRQPGKFLHRKYSDLGAESYAEYINVPNSYNELADGNPIILKLPGTVESQDPRFAITEDDYFEYLTNRELTNLLPVAITGKLKASQHLFLGYSPCNWNMRALLYRIWEDRRSSLRESWAVLNDSETLDETFWRACSVTIVHSDLNRYIEGLNARVFAAS